MKVLVTGGTGYIGSHTCVQLLEQGYEVVIIDNLINSKVEVVDKIEAITDKKIKFYEGDVCDKQLLTRVFKEEKIDAVIHFAGLKAVGESIKMPLRYYRNNIDSTLSLCEVMNEFNIKNVIFSSSATVYGTPEELPLKETSKIGGTTNPYGSSKLYIENMLNDLYISDDDWNITILRYFNPVGSHDSGLLGESPNGIPNNLMPYIVKVACGELECLSIFGDDYETPDGTGVRDYIHVIDLADGHVKALDKMQDNKGVSIYNLGTGNGYSVMDMVKTFEKVNKVKVAYKIVARREGDIAECYADSSKAYEELGWKATRTLSDMVSSAYNYAIKNKK